MSGRRRAPAGPTPASAPGQTSYPSQVQVHRQPGAEITVRTQPNAPPGGRAFAPQSREAPPPRRYTQEAGGGWQEPDEGDYAPPAGAQSQGRPHWKNFADRVRGATAVAVEERAQYGGQDLIDAVGEQAGEAGGAFLELVALALSTRGQALRADTEVHANDLVDAVETHAAAAQALYHGSRQQYGDEATREAGDLAHDVPAVARIARVLIETMTRPQLVAPGRADELPPSRAIDAEPPPPAAPAPKGAEKTPAK